MRKEINFNKTLSNYYTALYIYNEKVLEENSLNSSYNDNIQNRIKNQNNIPAELKEAQNKLESDIFKFSVWDRNRMIEENNQKKGFLILKEKVHTIKYSTCLIFEAVLTAQIAQRHTTMPNFSRKTLKRHQFRLEEAGILRKETSKAANYQISQELIIYY